MSVFQPLLDSLNQIYPMPTKLVKTLEQNLEIKEVTKGTILLEEGQVSSHASAVLSGLLRSYYYINDDVEVTSRFTPEGEIVLSVNSFYSREPGYEYLIAEEDSILARLSYEHHQKLLEDFLEYNFIVRVQTEKYYRASEQHLAKLRKQNAQERWAYFIEAYPDLLPRVQLSHIASFLGMNLETLSRVRRKDI